MRNSIHKSIFGNLPPSQRPDLKVDGEVLGDPEEIVNNLSPKSNSKIMDKLMRANNLKSVYTTKSNDPRESTRIKSLQILCFKIVNHKVKLLEMLEKYDISENTPENANDPTSNQRSKIPLKSLQEVMRDFTLITGLVFM